jgi:phosphopantetheine adenylyltransferase
LVKQVADLDGQVKKYVSEAVARALASSGSNRKAQN